MQRLECPVDGCSSVFEAESEDEVMAEAGEHAAERHPDLEMDAETTQMLRDQIRTV